jgi:cold shock CspA family protein
MIWFNGEKEHGFIRTEAGERLYVHASGFREGEVPAGRCAGMSVSFDREEAEGDARAVNVAFVPEAVVRRARMRGRAGR